MTAVAAEIPPPPAPPTDLDRAGSPYKFLDFYERRDAANFAGRDQEIDDIAAGVARSRCFVLYGRSGLGKTSLLHAGVIPRLEQRGFEVRYLRILADPVQELCAAVATQIERDAITADELPALLAARPRPFVLVLDQFEEFFLQFSGNTAVQAQFAGLLGKILDEAGEWVRLVISLREDYYAQLQDLERTIPDLTAHGHRLVSLSAYGVRQAVVRPLIRAGITYEEQFVDRVIDELAAFDFDPLLLQIVCAEVYDDAARDARTRADAMVELRAAHIERSGGLHGALTRYVAAVSEALAGDDRLIACAVLDALTTAENTKRAMRLSNLLPPARGRPTPEPRAPHREPDLTFYLRATPDELRRVLDRLGRARLVRRVQPAASPGATAERPADCDEWYELLHDRLVPVIKAWLDAEPAFDRFRFAKKLIASLSGGRTWRDEPGALLSAGQLTDQVQPYARRLRLSTGETEYVLRSAIHNLPGAVSAWAEIYDEATGAGSAAALVFDLLMHSRSAVRYGAARAIVGVVDPHHELPPRCATTSLHDSNEEVRRAAGRSLARVARPAELNAIKVALRARPTAPRAFQVVADLVQFGGPTHELDLSHSERYAATRLMRHRLYYEHRDRIRERTTLGTIHGLAAGAIYIPLIGTPTIAILLWCMNPTTVADSWPRGWLLATVSITMTTCICATVLAGLVGWRGGVRLAQAEAVGGSVAQWSGAGVRGPMPMFITWLLSTIVIFAPNTDAGVTPIGLASGLAIIVWLLGPSSVRWIQRTITPGGSILHAAIWSAVSSASVTLGGFVTIALIAIALQISNRHRFELTMLFLVVGLHFCVAGLVLYGGTARCPIAERPSYSAAERCRARILAVSPFVAVLLALVALWFLVE